jgi:hypothetical protein
MAPRLPTDPHYQKGADATSPNFYPKGQRQGSIVGYDSQSDSYSVVVEGAPGDWRSSRKSFPNVVRNKTPGIETVLNPAIPVLVDFGSGNQPVIMGSVSTNAVRTATADAVAIDAGGMVPPASEVRAGAYFRDPGTPKNMLPGDQFITTPDGNYISVTRGRMNKVFGSHRAQIIVSGMHDAVRVVCENYEHLSAIGELKIQTMDGRSSLSFVGRVDQKSERDDGRGCIAIDIGDKGQLFKLEIRDASGNMVSQQQFTPSGTINLFSTEVLNTLAGQDRIENVGGRRYSRIEGDETVIAGGNRFDGIEGGWGAQVGSSGTFTFGQNYSLVAQSGYNMYAGGNTTNVMTGGAMALSNPINVAKLDKIVNGSHVTYIGYPNHGADLSGKAMAGMRTYLYNGAIVFGDELPGEVKVSTFTPVPSMMTAFCVNTPKPDSIGLGGVTAAAAALLGGETPSAINPVVKHTELAAFFTKLLGFIDGHTHTVKMVGAKCAPPDVPISTTMSGDYLSFASTIVKLFS